MLMVTSQVCPPPSCDCLLGVRYDSIAFIMRGNPKRLKHLKRGRSAFADPWLPSRLKATHEYALATAGAAAGKTGGQKSGRSSRHPQHPQHASPARHHGTGSEQERQSSWRKHEVNGGG